MPLKEKVPRNPRPGKAAPGLCVLWEFQHAFQEVGRRARASQLRYLFRVRGCKRRQCGRVRRPGVRVHAHCIAHGNGPITMGHNYIGHNYTGQNSRFRVPLLTPISDGEVCSLHPRPPPCTTVMAYAAMAYRVMAYTVMAYTVVADIVMAYIVMAYTVMAYIAMAYIVMAYVAMAYVAMTYVAMAYVAMAYTVMAYVAMAYTVMAYTVIAYIVMA